MLISRDSIATPAPPTQKQVQASVSSVGSGNQKLLSVVLALFATFFALTHFVRDHYIARASGYLSSDHRTPAPIDFNMIYLGATDLRDHYSPRDPRRPTKELEKELHTTAAMYFPLFTGLLYVPLTYFNLKTAQVIWLTMSLAFVIPSIWLIAWLSSRRTGFVEIAFVTFLAISSAPLRFVLDFGQVNNFILLLLAAAMVLSEHRRDYSAGATLLAAALLKPIPALLFLPFILGRRWRVLVGAVGGCAGIVGLSTAIWGWGILAEMIGPIVKYSQSPFDRPINQSIDGFLLRSFTENQFATCWLNNPLLAQILWFAAAALLMGAAVLTTLKRPSNIVLNCCLWLSLALLISPISLEHYFVWLLMPLCVLSRQFLEQKRWFALSGVLVSYLLLNFSPTAIESLSRFQHGLWMLLCNLPMFAILALYGLTMYALHTEQSLVNDEEPPIFAKG